LNSGSLESIQSAIANLEGASHKIAEVLYRATASAGASGASGPGATAGSQEPGHSEEPRKSEGDVIDAEYVDVDESKKPN
jgi:molecular chaperone DnaK